MNTRAVLAIAGANLRRLGRDKTGAFFVFVFPFLIILAFGAAFGTGFTPKVGVVGASSGGLARDLGDRLGATDGIAVVTFTDEGSMRTAIERGQLEGGVVIPPDYDQRIRGGGTAPIDYVARPNATQELRLTVGAVVDAQNAQVRAARFAVEEGVVANFDAAFAQAGETASRYPGITVATRIAGGEGEINTFATGAAQELVLFIFLTSLSASSMLIETRRLGVTRRMLAAPVGVRTILVGEALGRFAIALVQGTLIVLGTRLLFGVEWGNPATTTIVVFLFALAATGAAMLMGSVLHNASQAGAMGVFLGLVLAAIGGCMVPLEVFPAGVRTVAHAFPHAWAIDSLTASIAREAGPGEVVGGLAVLTGYAIALLTVASVLLRRSITRSAG
jgi:ABC-2 type transport system permease protein